MMHRVAFLVYVLARGGFEYFIMFTDDYLGHGYAYLKCHKSVAFEKFKEFTVESESN